MLSDVELRTMLLTASVAAACAVPGVFLVLRRLAMLSDAMGHVLLFGIVVAYGVVGSLDSPWLKVGAVLSALLTVVLVEQLERTRLLKEDAALGLVFPALFSAGVLISSMNFRDTHLDVDQVLLGHVEFAGKWDALPMLGLLVLNLVLVACFFGVLKLTTFDPTLATMLGFAPVAVHYGLMTISSITVVAAFDAVGPILVGAFVVLPAITARLFVDRLAPMIALAVGMAILGATLGVRLAFAFGTNTAGMAAATCGLLYLLAFLASPKRGLIAVELRRQRLRREWLTMLNEPKVSAG